MALDGFTPFPDEFARVYREEGYWEDKPLIDVLLEACHRYSDRIAVISDDVRLTYGQLAQRSERLARHLYGMGVRPLDRIVVHLPNMPEFIVVYLALQRLGAIPLMALPPHREHEIGHYVDFIEAVGYVVPDRIKNFDFIEFARGIKDRARTLEWVLVVGDTPSERDDFVSMSHLLAGESDVSTEVLDGISIDPEEPCVFQLSGGTTGIPKVIPRTHNDYVYNTKAISRFNDIRPDDALLVVIPIAHNFPLACPGIQGFFLSGARVVLSTTTRGSHVLPLIDHESVTHLELAPALVIMWLNDPAIEDAELSSVRIINTGGQKFQPATKRRAEEAFPNAVVQEIFGMAEGLLMIVRLDDPEEVRMETVGREVSPHDEVRLVDDEGNDVVQGEVGELITRGPYTLRGYYKVPEINARSFTPDGFYRSGDVLREHPSGNYIVEGRKKDLINRGGEKISAEEVEDMILTHSAVENAACVPMPDDVLGERMCVYVILHEGQSLDLEGLSTFLIDKGLARFKHPERLEILDEFPISPFGKVMKSELAERIAADLGGAA
jgi:2,3-dihydroxybenzoate-AMP ligase